MGQSREKMYENYKDLLHEFPTDNPDRLFRMDMQTMFISLLLTEL